jgi:hypothetical protein
MDSTIDASLELKSDDDIYTSVLKSHIKHRLEDGSVAEGKMNASEIE